MHRAYDDVLMAVFEFGNNLANFGIRGPLTLEVPQDLFIELYWTITRLHLYRIPDETKWISIAYLPKSQNPPFWAGASFESNAQVQSLNVGLNAIRDGFELPIHCEMWIIRLQEPYRTKLLETKNAP